MSQPAGSNSTNVTTVNFADFDPEDIVDARLKKGAFELADGMPNDAEVLKTLRELRVDLTSGMLEDPEYSGKPKGQAFDPGMNIPHYVHGLERHDIPEDVIESQYELDREQIEGTLNGMKVHGAKALNFLQLAPTPVDAEELTQAMNTLRRAKSDPTLATGPRGPILERAERTLAEMIEEMAHKPGTGKHGDSLRGRNDDDTQRGAP